MPAMAKTNTLAKTNRLPRAPARWQIWLAHTLARGLAYFGMIFEAFGEGQQMARDAHKRFPFAEW